MKKSLISFAVIAAMVLPAVSTFAAFTMTSSALTYDNGRTTVEKDYGDTVDLTIHGQLTSPNQIQSVRVSWPSTKSGDGICYNVDDVEITGSRYVVVDNVVLPDIKTGGNVSPKTEYFDSTAHNNQECDGTPFASKTFTNSVHIRPMASVPQSTVTPTTPSSGGSQAKIDELLKQIADLKAQLAAIGNSSKPAWCAEFATKLSAATPGADQTSMGINSPNGKLQAFLIAKGYSIPALYPVQHTAYGFYLNQTTGAVNQALTACSGQ